MKLRILTALTTTALAAGLLGGCDTQDVTTEASATLEELVLLAIEAAEAGDVDTATRSLEHLRSAVERLRADGQLSDARAEEILLAAAHVDTLLLSLENSDRAHQRSSPGPDATLAQAEDVDAERDEDDADTSGEGSDPEATDEPPEGRSSDAESSATEDRSVEADRSQRDGSPGGSGDAPGRDEQRASNGEARGHDDGHPGRGGGRARGRG